MNEPERIYGWLLKLYPARFREEYGSPMERQFRDDYREATTRSEKAVLWMRALWDLASTIPAELGRETAQDLKHAIRLYRNRKLSAALAILSLGLAIGVSTGVFSVLNAVLLRGLPFSDPSQLVEIWLPPVSPMQGREPFREWRTQSVYLQDAAAYSTTEMNLTQPKRDALRVKAAETSANFFALLGTRPALGRTFAADEDRPGGVPVAVISHSLWQQVFGGPRDAEGAELYLDGVAVTVIGVAPARFDYPGGTNIWLSTAFAFEKMPKFGAFALRTIGRVKPQLTLAQAQRLFEDDVRRIAPASLDRKDHASLSSLRDNLAGRVKDASWTLAAMILFVLLTACANIVHLLLTRTSERHQELAVRTALGAGRGRLVQQLITEATAMTGIGAAIGLIVAYWTCRLASLAAPAQLATQQYTVLDWRVFAFATALALSMGLLFGVIPSFLIGRLQPSSHRTQSGTGEGARRMRAGLIAIQAALTLVLVTSSVTLGRTFLDLLHTDLGFRPANTVTLSVSLQGTPHRRPDAAWRYYSDVLERLRAVPGVEAAGAVSYLPLKNNMYMLNAITLDTGQKVEMVVTNAATSGYFSAMGTNLQAGRDFAASVNQEPEMPVIVDDAFAAKSGLGNAVVGHTFMTRWSKKPYRIAGVVPSILYGGPGSRKMPQMFWPIEEEPPPVLTFAARVRGDAASSLAKARDAVRSVDRGVAVFDVKTLQERLDETLASPRFYASGTLFLAGFAALLAAVGIFGTAAYAIAQRRREVGVRLALGASHQRVRGMLVRENLLPVLAGLVAGIFGAMESGEYLQHLVEGAHTPEPWTLIAGAAFLVLIGLAAAWAATTRVLTIDPAEAVRAE